MPDLLRYRHRRYPIQVSVPACSHGGAAGGMHNHAADSFELFFSPETNTWLKADAMEACEYEQAVQACLASLHPSPAVAVTVERENLSRIRASHAVLPENGLDYSASGCEQQPGAAAGTCAMRQPSSPYLITPSRPDLGLEKREGENGEAETAETAEREGEDGYSPPFALRATEARTARCRGNERGGGGGRARNRTLAGERVGAVGDEEEHGVPAVDGAELGSVDGDAREDGGTTVDETLDLRWPGWSADGDPREGSGGAKADERLECTRLEVRAGGSEGVEVLKTCFILLLYLLPPLPPLPFAPPPSPPAAGVLRSELRPRAALPFAPLTPVAPRPPSPLCYLVPLIPNPNLSPIPPSLPFLPSPPARGALRPELRARAARPLARLAPRPLRGSPGHAAHTRLPAAATTVTDPPPTPPGTDTGNDPKQDWCPSPPPPADTYTDPGSVTADPASTGAPAGDTNTYTDSGAAVDPAWGAGTDPNAATADNTADIAAATDAAASSGASSGATDASGASSGVDGSVSFVSNEGGDPSSSDSSGGDSSGGDSSEDEGPLTSNPSYGATMGGDEAMDSTTCNIYEGEWVWDEDNRPAYNMDSCPFINSVSPTTNCLRQKYGRQDHSWMRYSWKPKQCGGNILRFQAADFAQKMQNKVITLVGDSLITDGFMPSLLCQLAQVGTVSRVEGSALGSFVWRLDSHNLTIANYWSPFLMWTSANPVVIRKLRVQDPGLGDTAVNLGAFDPQWFDQVQAMDLIVFQSATHWPHAERWLRRFFVDRKWHRLDPEPDTMTAYKQALNKLGKSFNAGNSKRWDLPVPYFLSAPPRLVNCQGSYTPANRSTQYEHMVRGNPQSRKWFPAQRDVLSPSKNIRFVDITHPSLYRSDAMLASQSPDSKDCLHPCLPGLPDIWVDLFYEVWKADPEFNS
ncbi:unnamed protein product [Closterium sp. Naga37s-1]|nr:unnamed protein product [Closterium sp. Naga37s-1]